MRSGVDLGRVASAPFFLRSTRRLLTSSLLCIIGTVGFAGAARANLIIVPTFDASITGDPNSAAIQTGINNAIAEIASYIANPVTVTITFKEGGGLGESSTFYSNTSYTSYLAALQNNQTRSTRDNTAIGTLSAGPNNPVNGDTNVHLSTPLLRRLGFSGNTGGADDSTISLNTTITNNLRTGPQDPDKYDLEQVALHEITEVLGAGGGGSTLPTLNSSVGPLDLFRYSAQGTRSFTGLGTAKAYFSINGGQTNLGNFNQDGNGDYADWGSNASPQVQDAFSTPAVQLNLNANELVALDVVGWDLTAAGSALEATSPVPEPASMGVIALGVVGLLGRRRAAIR